MHPKESIKKIFQNNAAIKDPASPKKILEKIQNKASQIEAMKHILTRVKEGEDMDPFFNEVIKIIDTRNSQLKKLTNIYLKKYTKGKTIRQLLCVNTFLKDLSDRSSTIRKACLEVIGFMGDEVVLGNYLNKLKKLEDDGEVQLEVVNALVHFPNGLFLGEVVKGLIYSDDSLLSTQALCCLSTANPAYLENEDLVDLLKRKECDALASSFIMKMMFKKRETIQIDISTLLRTLRVDYLSLFYFTASLLLHLDPNYKQLVYDTSLLYMKQSPETLYHLLLFQEPLLNHVTYSNSNYLLYDNDPLFLKKQKLKMLFYRLDDVSINEIKRCKDETLVLTILKLSLKKNFVIQNIFNSSLDLLDVLYANYPFSNAFTHLVSSYLGDLDTSLMAVPKLKKFLFLSGSCCSTRPGALDFIEKIESPALSFDILKFYVGLCKREIINKEEFKEHVKRLKKNSCIKDKAKFVLEVVNKGNLKDLFEFGEGFIKAENKKQPIQLWLGSEKVQNKVKVETSLDGTLKSLSLEEEILSCKPYKDTTHSFSFDLQLPSLKPQASPWLTTPSSGDVIVDTRHLKGTLILRKDSIHLEVDVLETPVKVSFGFEKIEDSKKEKIIQKEENYKLEELSLNKLNQNFRLCIGNQVFEVFVDHTRFIVPYECTINDFEEAFRNLNNYKLINKIPEAGLYQVDDSSFAFQILNHCVYGKKFCGQAVLKGEKEVLDLFY